MSTASIASDESAPTCTALPQATSASYECLAAKKQGILQRAAESKRIAYNPQRVVRKARLPRAAEVQPLAPTAIEAQRAELPERDAMAISVLAYAGLRPGELRGLRWQHVGERTVLVDAEKTGLGEA